MCRKITDYVECVEINSYFVYSLAKEADNIYKVSSYLTRVLSSNKIIGDDKIEACTYGIQITMANLINFVIAFGIGLFTRSLMEIAVFYCIFVSLRFFCGGYHAKSYGRCFLLFAATCLIYLVLLNGILIYVKNPVWLLGAAVILLGTCIFVKAPIEHTNRPFTAEERKLFRKKSIQLFLAWSVVGILLWMGRLEHLAAGLISVFLIVSIYMVIEGREEDEEKDT